MLRTLSVLTLLGGIVARAHAAPPAPLFEPGLAEEGFLARADPRTAGLDRGALEALIRDAEATRSDALIVIKDGRVVLERTFGRPTGLLPSMSVTKSIVSIAVGLLLHEGKISSVDAPLGTWFPEWRQGPRAKVTLRHVLTQTSGLQHGPGTRDLYPQNDRLRYARERQLAGMPGGRFDYNNDATQLLSGIIAAAAGKPVDAYLEERLFRPLGIHVQWERDPAGNVHTFGDLAIGARDLARLGQLMLDDGAWHGRQLVPAAWIRESTRPARPDVPFYGYLWWVVPDGRQLRQDPGFVDTLRRAGFGGAAKLARLGDRAFTHREAYLLEAGALLEPAERAQLAGLITATGAPLKARVGAPVGFKADGWLGQYLVVIPGARLVALRMHRPIAGNGDDENQRYGFFSFSDRVRALVPAPVDARTASAAPQAPRSRLQAPGAR
ncbi:MAG TPA: serine hydrolase [Polyangia bacterium]|jgi:CubicO group peptidase (beta-lactamase class C family)